MPLLVEDEYIEKHGRVTHPVSELEDCSIAVDGTYYLQHLLEGPREPLLPALGGLTGIQSYIEKDLDYWQEFKITPFFIFDGQPMQGQDEVSASRGRRDIEKTNYAWVLYFERTADKAVAEFGANSGAFRVQTLFPLLQGILKQRGLHFLVPPFNAAAQIAYFDMTDSDQCAGIMGSQELLLYPVRDSIIKSFDWENKKVDAISKKRLLTTWPNGITEQMFIDARLMVGTSFLPTYPPLQDSAVYASTSIMNDAVNMLRTQEKSVAAVCSLHNDVLQAKDPHWLDKYQKARMALNHFIYIAETGEVKVHEYDKLTRDNYEYLGLQLPSELFHYLNTGLIGPRILGWLTHSQIMVLPDLCGVQSEEYSKLVSSQLVPLREMTLGLVAQRLNRGIWHKDILMKVWYNDKFVHKINGKTLPVSHSNRAATWNIKEAAMREHFPEASSGTISFEVLALQKPGFVTETIFTEDKRKLKGLDSSDVIVSIAIWRFLHLRGYVTDGHELTAWGSALAATLSALEPVVAGNPGFVGLMDAALVAFELLQFDILNTRNRHEDLNGVPSSGTEDDKASLLLISRCTTLLKLRHDANGYTGPLSKNLLAFHSLVSAVRDADRDLMDGVIANMFLFGQAKRDRDDLLDIGQRLPFLQTPDIGLAIAIKTFFDQITLDLRPEDAAKQVSGFPSSYVPYATNLMEDLVISADFFDALCVGIKTLDKEVSKADKLVWEKAHQYLDARRNLLELGD